MVAMSALYYANVTVHILAAMLWLGGMFFLGVVGAPLLRSVEPDELRQKLFQAIGERFRAVAWWTIAVLIVTGAINLRYRGWLHWNGVFGSSAFWRTTTGHSLGVKLAAVTGMIVVGAIHDFIQGPRASRTVPGSPESVRFRRNAAALARINAILGVIVVAAAVRLARGG